MDNHLALEKLQDRFCIIDINSEIRVLDRTHIQQVRCGLYKKELSFYKRQDANMLMRRHLESLPIACKSEPVIQEFWTHPSTKMYNSTAFTPEPTTEETLNHWIPHTVPSIDGDCKLIEDFLFEVICSEEVASYNYLLCFLSHMLQNPSEKPGIVPVLLGRQGTGKGVFFQLLQAIWSKTFLLVSDIDEVVGKFNAALERNYIICMDEALFVGDKKSINKLVIGWKLGQN